MFSYRSISKVIVHAQACTLVFSNRNVHRKIIFAGRGLTDISADSCGFPVPAHFVKFYPWGNVLLFLSLRPPSPLTMVVFTIVFLCFVATMYGHTSESAFKVSNYNIIKAQLPT